MTRTLLLLLVLLLPSGCAPYRVRRDLSYGPGARQTYDVYEPAADDGAPRPALLVIHGGGYVSGDKAWAEAVARTFCDWGYVVVAMNYTLCPAGVWPLQLEEARAALAHLRSTDSGWMNLREPIAGLGVSAGAHLVAALHLHGDLPCAIGVSGPWDFVNASSEQLDGALRSLLGLPSDAPIPDEARADLSPVSWITPDADMLLVHATRDPLTVYEHARRLEAALRKVGAKVELVTVDSRSHGSTWKRATEDMRRWLEQRQ